MVVQLINSYLGYTLTHPYTQFQKYSQGVDIEISLKNACKVV